MGCNFFLCGLVFLDLTGLREKATFSTYSIRFFSYSNIQYLGSFLLDQVQYIRRCLCIVCWMISHAHIQLTFLRVIIHIRYVVKLLSKDPYIMNSFSLLLILSTTHCSLPAAILCQQLQLPCQRRFLGVISHASYTQLLARQ